MTTLTVNLPTEQLLKLKAALEEGKKVTLVVKDKKTKKAQPAAHKNGSHEQSKRSQKPEHIKSAIVSDTKDDIVQLSSPKKSVKLPRPLPFAQNERVMNALDWLYMTFPKLFKKQEKVPLKVGVLSDIFVWLDAHKANSTEENCVPLPTKTAIRDAVRFYTMNTCYQKALVEHDKRYDLGGLAVEDVQDVHKTYATERHMKIEETIKAQNEKRKAYHVKKKASRAEKAHELNTNEPSIIEDALMNHEEKTSKES